MFDFTYSLWSIDIPIVEELSATTHTNGEHFERICTRHFVDQKGDVTFLRNPRTRYPGGCELLYRCHKILGTYEYGDPGSFNVVGKFDGGAHLNSKMRNKIGTWVPILPVIWGPGFPNVRDTQNFMTSDGHADRGIGIGNETKPHPQRHIF